MTKLDGTGNMSIIVRELYLHDACQQQIQHGKMVNWSNDFRMEQLIAVA